MLIIPQLKKKWPNYVLSIYPFKLKDTNKWKVKGWKKINLVNRNPKKGGVVMLSDKRDFKAKKFLEIKKNIS